MASGARQVRYTNVYVKTVHHENFGVFVGKRVDVQIQNHGLMFSGALHLPFKSIAKALISKAKPNLLRLAMDATNLRGPGLEMVFQPEEFEHARSAIMNEVMSQGGGGASSASAAKTLTFDDKKAYKVLLTNPSMKELYKRVVPPLTPNEFWDSHKAQLESDEPTPGEVLCVGLSDFRSTEDHRRHVTTVGIDEIAEIFRKRPAVYAAFKKFVPHKMTEGQFFSRLVLEDQYKRGEIDRTHLNQSQRADREIDTFIENEEALLHQKVTAAMLQQSAPEFDLRDSTEEALRGPLAVRGGYGLVDRSMTSVENVEFEPTLTENHRRQSVTEDKEKMRMMQEYLVSQFNDEGNRLLQGSGHGGADTNQERLRRGRSGAASTEKGFVHPDFILDNDSSSYVPLVLNHSHAANMPSTAVTAEDPPRPAKRLKSEEVKAEVKPGLAAKWVFAREDAFLAHSVKPSLSQKSGLKKPTIPAEKIAPHFVRANVLLRFFWSLQQSKANSDRLRELVPRLTEEIAMIGTFEGISNSTKENMKGRLRHALRRYEEKYLRAVEASNTRKRERG
jgi:hypothetical protein